MRCAACGAGTVRRPCDACGGEPLLGGRYRLLARLGEGAHGTTWCARDTRSGDEVAVKEVVLGPAGSKRLALWEREVRVLRQLDHPRIPAVIDSFVVRTGRQRTGVLVQSLVTGRDLASEHGQRRYRPDEVLDVARELLDVLEYLHTLSPPVIHRDLKPANVVRDARGALHLVDFGSVRDRRADTLGGSTIVGTFGYMAPEQFRGDATPATDLYGLGVLLVTLLGRRPPHDLLDGNGRLQWRRAFDAEPAMARLLDALLDPDPARRPRDAGAVRALLPGRLVSPPRFPARRALAACVGLAGILMVSGWVLRPDDPVRTPRTARAAAAVPTLSGEGPGRRPRRSVEAPLRYLANDGPDPIEVGGQEVPVGTIRAVPAPDGWLGPADTRRVYAPDDALVRRAGETWTLTRWPAREPVTMAAPWPAGRHEAPLACTLDVVTDGAGGTLVHDGEGCPAGLVGHAAWVVAGALDAVGPGRGPVTVVFEPTSTPREVLVARGDADAALHVDGVAVGRLPWTGALAPGDHLLEVDGRRHRVAVRAGDGIQWVRLPH